MGWDVADGEAGSQGGGGGSSCFWEDVGQSGGPWSGLAWERHLRVCSGGGGCVEGLHWGWCKCPRGTHYHKHSALKPRTFILLQFRGQKSKMGLLS